MLGHWAKAVPCRFSSGSPMDDRKKKTEKKKEGVPSVCHKS